MELRYLRRLPAHSSMLAVSALIYRTCGTYLLQQAKMLAVLEVLIGAIMVFYFYFLEHMEAGRVAIILAWSVVGVAGSFGVSWFGVVINNVANSRMSFASLRGKALPLSEIPMRSGMSIGVLLISVELVLMLSILKFVDRSWRGCVLWALPSGSRWGQACCGCAGGFSPRLRTWAATDEDRVSDQGGRRAQPGRDADCAGDNAGDSVGPTAGRF